MLTDPTIPYIIAEAATCHASPRPAERMEKALAYVEAAASAGANAVKFQMFTQDLSDMFCWIDGDEKRSERWVQSAMSLEQWEYVKAHADGSGIDLLASVFQSTTVEWIANLGLRATKVASRAARAYPYGDGPKPYLVSDGMFGKDPISGQTTFSELFSVDWWASVQARNDVIHMQCEANYPSHTWWGERGNQAPGFSDHSGRTARAIDALERGCKLLEVHFYIREDDAGPDLPASLNLTQLERVCSTL